MPLFPQKPSNYRAKNNVEKNCILELAQALSGVTRKVSPSPRGRGRLTPPRQEDRNSLFHDAVENLRQMAPPGTDALTLQQVRKAVENENGALQCLGGRRWRVGQEERVCGRWW